MQLTVPPFVRSPSSILSYYIAIGISSKITRRYGSSWRIEGAMEKMSSFASVAARLML